MNTNELITFDFKQVIHFSNDMRDDVDDTKTCCSTNRVLS